MGHSNQEVLYRIKWNLDQRFEKHGVESFFMSSIKGDGVVFGESFCRTV